MTLRDDKETLGLFEPLMVSGGRRTGPAFYWLQSPEQGQSRARAGGVMTSELAEQGVVEPRGIEPLTSSLRTTRSPN